METGNVNQNVVYIFTPHTPCIRAQKNAVSTDSLWGRDWVARALILYLNVLFTGLTLTLDVQMKEYTSLALEEGIRVLIEDQDVRLYPEMHGFSIRPGVKANIALKKVLLLPAFILRDKGEKNASRSATSYKSFSLCLT